MNLFLIEVEHFTGQVEYVNQYIVAANELSSAIEEVLGHDKPEAFPIIPAATAALTQAANDSLRSIMPEATMPECDHQTRGLKVYRIGIAVVGIRPGLVMTSRKLDPYEPERAQLIQFPNYRE